MEYTNYFISKCVVKDRAQLWTVNKIRQNDLGEEKILFFTALKDLVGFAEVEKIRERLVVLRNIRKNFPKPSFNPQYIDSNRKKKK